MTETIQGHLYDYPKYYDVVYGSDWKPEFDFLRACFAKHAKIPVKRLFEPACGTGRLLIKFAQAGYDVSGNDLNPKAVDYCNRRLERHGFAATAVVGDMADFSLKRRADAAYNMINSFRHLPSQEAAEGHLRSVTHSLRSGGLYVMGLHLIPTGSERIEKETWSARRGHLAVVSSMWSEGVNLRKRQEHIGMAFDVYTPTRHMRIIDQMIYRTYTAGQMEQLLAGTPDLEVVETYDFVYDIEQPVAVGPETEDVVYVLRKK